LNGTSSDWQVYRSGSYRYFNDNNQTESQDKIVLTSTSDRLDIYLACDPNVVKINHYYCIGYTSTINLAATQNQLFLVRSLTPNGMLLTGIPVILNQLLPIMDHQQSVVLMDYY
jgi:hypothetical protein